MAMIFKSRGTIPDRPGDLYAAIVRLVVEDWDQHRRVRRPSKYAALSIDTKGQVLADLALRFSRRQLTVFGHGDLIAAYEAVHERYGLPENQAVKVAKELEGHTGLIVDVGQRYQFSHLALQEYLAADALVRGGTRSLEDWWRRFPAVAAVSLSRASDPNAWFADLCDAIDDEINDNRPIQTFMTRIALEKPRFTPSAELGRLVLWLLWKGHVNDWPGTHTYEGTALAKSIVLAVETYDNVRVTRRTVRLSSLGVRNRPESGVIVDASILEELIGKAVFADRFGATRR